MLSSLAMMRRPREAAEEEEAPEASVTIPQEPDEWEYEKAGGYGGEEEDDFYVESDEGEEANEWPKEWRVGVVVPMWKKKGKKTNKNTRKK